MKKKHLIIVFLILSSINTIFAQANKDTYFEKYKEKFLMAYWAVHPEQATYNGYHGYNHILSIPSVKHRKNLENFQELHLRELASIRNNLLKDENKIDFDLMWNRLKTIFWQLRIEKSWEWDPSQYNLYGIFSYMLNENYAPINTRLFQIYERLEWAPLYYEEAIKSIKNPTVPLKKLAIEQHQGANDFFLKTLIDSVNKSNFSTIDKTNIIRRIVATNTAMNRYLDYLKSLNDNTARSFRLGKELYHQAFIYHNQSEYTAEQIFDFAKKRKSELHHEMEKIALQLWPKYFGNNERPKDPLLMIRAVLDTIAANHTTPQLFQETIERQIPQLVEFVNRKNLLYLDPSKPLVVRKEPAYMGGVAGASISAPGPYEAERNTYYNVGSIVNWPKEKAESYLREYNNYTLQILNIHEAIPGHYTQLVYANKAPSKIKSVFSNGAMIEGWAVYSELMMLENGYGDNELEMWLAWYKWHLRTVCNTILDYSVHVLNMSEEEAIKLLTYEAFQQQAEAEGKWKRVTVSNVQLTSYFTGYKEIYDLRDLYKKRKGSGYHVKDFNEQFLSYGNAPVKYIKQLILK